MNRNWSNQKANPALKTKAGNKYKSGDFFPDAIGQLTPQSLVRSSRISNSSEML